MSPAKQQQVVDEIAAQIEPSPSAAPDYPRIKRNVAKMIDAGAPEADVDAYLDEEGVTAAQLRQHRPSQSHTGGLTPRASHGGDNADHIVDAKLATIARAMGVGIDDPLTPDQLEAFRDAYVQTEGSKTNNVGNLKNVGGEGFQVFPTEDAGRAAIDAQIRRDYNRGQTTIRSLIEGYPIGAQLTPPQVRAEGFEAPADDVQASNYDPRFDGPPPGTPIGSRTPPNGDEDSFLRMPKDWNEVGKGLAIGTGDVVEGLADIPGLAIDPINTLIGRAMGYKGYTSDFGKTVRESLGLPEDDSLKGDIIRGASGGLGTAGIAGLLAKAGGGAVASGLKEMASTPIRDAVGGAGAALASGVAERAGAPVPVQIAAGLAGGASSALGIRKAATEAPRLLDTAAAERIVPQVAQQRFQARQAMNKYRSHDREISRDLDTLIQNVRGDSRRKPTKTQARVMASRIDELEDSYMPIAEVKALDLPPSVKARLNAAMAKRHLLSDDEVSALADGTPAGDAVSEAIFKARRLRSILPESSLGNISGGLAEALAGAAGSKLAGPLGRAVGRAAGKALRPSHADATAKKALKVAADAPKFAKMDSLAADVRTARSARDKLAQIAAKAMDTPYLDKQTADAEAARLEAEGRKVAIANARDDVRPSGGWRGLIYDRTGLLPSQQDAGALSALKDGHISPEQFDAFLNSPDKLMHGNAGNALTDRLASMADEGKLQRDPDWLPPSRDTEVPTPPPGIPAVNEDGAPFVGMGEADGQSYPMYGEVPASKPAIRNPAAYAATAKANQDRVSQSLQAVHANADLGDDEREIIASAVTSIGNTSSKAKAQAIATDALDRLGEGRRDYASSILAPLVQQVKK